MSKSHRTAKAAPLSTVGLLLELRRHLTERRRRQLPLLLALMLLGALLETVSLGAIIPFLGALSAPERVLAQPAVARLAALLGIASPGQLLLTLAAGFAAAALASTGVRLLILWLSTYVSYAIGGEFSLEAYRRTLHQPYPVHVGRNSSVVVSGIFKKTSVATSVVYQAMNLASSAVLAAAIVAALLVIDARIALLAGGAFGAFYVLVTTHSRRALFDNSRRISQQEDETLKVLQEGLGGIRDVLLDGAQAPYLEKYSRVNAVMRYAQGRNVFIAYFPRYAMEAVGMLVIAALAYSSQAHAGSFKSSDALPVLGAFALAAQRLLPALQQIYTAWASIVGSHKQVSDVLELLDQPLPETAPADAAPMGFSRQVRLEGVKFRYADGGPWVLRGLDLVVPKGGRIGIAGSTGSGKSTLVDLFMGLLEPTEGRVLVDERPLSAANMRSWQRCIAHVPQSIFLADASVAENIALGVPKDVVDMASVRRAAAQARIAEFIESSPEGYDTLVGERGIRLSGGQRQRIGIARALYKRAPVLVLDEATSALDNETEELVMQTIEGLDKGLTVLVVAHRLTTLRHCDRIVELAGDVVEHGSYGEFLKTPQASGFPS